jgi:ribonuclease P protein component
MLQKENRLTKVRDFNLLVKHGRFFNNTFLSLKALHLADVKKHFPPKEDPDTFADQLKIAFAISVKISKSSVKRNRFRRQLREAVRLLLKEGAISSGWYLLFVAKSGCLDKEYEDIRAEAIALMKKSGALKR